jgi:hypothetical protein
MMGSLEERALAAAAEERRLAEENRERQRREQAQLEAEAEQRCVAHGISLVQKILGHTTIASDWTSRTEEVGFYNEDGLVSGVRRVAIASTEILGVKINTDPYRADGLRLANHPSHPNTWNGMTLDLASFGRALEDLKRRKQRLS